ICRLPQLICRAAAAAIDREKPTIDCSTAGFHSRNGKRSNIAELRQHGFGLAQKNRAFLLAIQKVHYRSDVHRVLFFDRENVSRGGLHKSRLVSSCGGRWFGREFHNKTQLWLRVFLPRCGCGTRRDDKRRECSETDLAQAHLLKLCWVCHAMV